jgi:hypothetical protein
MRFWSEGLGERQLVIGLGKARIEQQGEIMLLSGVVESPAPWEYEVKVERADWETILKTAGSKEACGYIARRASLPLLADMVWSIIRFVALLAWFRAVRLARPRRPASAQPASAQSAEGAPASAGLKK